MVANKKKKNTGLSREELMMMCIGDVIQVSINR